jgi:hypothetical protein
VYKYLSSPDYSIWLIGALLEIGIVYCMVATGAVAKAKLAFTFAVLSVARELACFLVGIFLPPSSYAYTYWSFELLGYVLLIALGVQYVYSAVGKYFSLSAFFVALTAVLLATHPFVFSGAGWKTLFLVNLSHIAAFMRCALFLVAAIGGRRWAWPHRGIVASFGMAAACDLVFNAIREQSLWMHWNVLSRTYPATSLIYLSVWLVTIARPEASCENDEALIPNIKEQAAVALPE